MKRKKKTKSTKFKGLKLFLLIFSAFFVLTLIITFIFAYRIVNTVSISEISKDYADLGIKPEVVQKVEEIKVEKKVEVTNIALFGLDQDNLDDKGRSDVIIILSIDKSHNKIKLSSIMRDSYVNIADRGLDKINHAYAFGGPQLAIRTINENYNLNITDYAVVSFLNLGKIIDSLGGVPIDVKENEISTLNSYFNDKSSTVKGTYITKAGTHNLNGSQAVVYSRIRYIGNGDYERTDRQRRVLTALGDKIISLGVTKYPEIVSQLLPYVNTSMNKLDIVKTGLDVLGTGINTIEQQRFPVDGYCEGKMINGIYYLTFDKAATTEQLFKFIYEDVKPAAR
jgi:LCP family protein required for cell wall assembly